MCRVAWRAHLYAYPNSAQARDRSLLQWLRSRNICVSVNCGNRLAHRQWCTLPPLDPRWGVRPVSYAADHCGPSSRNTELDRVESGLLIPIGQEWWAETDRQGIPSRELLRWNPRW